MKTTLHRHALVIYFVIAYGIAWGGGLFLAGQKNFQASALGTPELGLMFVCMLLGPSLSSLVLTALLDGKQGLRNLFARMTRWRIGLNWNAVIFLTIPVLSISILLGSSTLVSPVYQIKFSFSQVAFGLAAGLMAGFFEETGWTGFALPRLQSKYSTLASGLILGVLWATWHIMADYWGNIVTFDKLWLPNFIIFWLVPLTSYRILMVWMHKNTNSLLAAQLMHAFYTGTLVAISPTTGIIDGMLWKALFAAALCMVLIVVVIKFGDNLSNKQVIFDVLQEVPNA